MGCKVIKEWNIGMGQNTSWNIILESQVSETVCSWCQILRVPCWGSVVPSKVMSLQCDLLVKGVETNLKNKQFPVDCVSDHGGCLDVPVRDIISLDVHLHLLLFQMQQQLKLLPVVLPAQGTFQQRPLEQIQQQASCSDIFPSWSEPVMTRCWKVILPFIRTVVCL